MKTRMCKGFQNVSISVKQKALIEKELVIGDSVLYPGFLLKVRAGSFSGVVLKNIRARSDKNYKNSTIIGTIVQGSTAVQFPTVIRLFGRYEAGWHRGSNGGWSSGRYFI